MADYTIGLTTEQETALGYRVEEYNNRLPAEVPEGDPPPVPWTPQTILQEIVDQDLLNTQRNADAMLAVHEQVLASVEPPLQDVLISTMSPASQRRVRELLATKWSKP